VFRRRPSELPTPEQALPGRSTPMRVAPTHVVLGTPMTGPWPDGTETAYFGMGCFWGAERMFWQAPGVWTTAVGYAGGTTPQPSYEQVCTGRTGHAEVVLAVFDPAATSYEEMLRIFWEGHDPTQGNRQGNDVGTQYRSAIFTTTEAQLAGALASRDRYQAALEGAGYGTISTQIAPAEQAGDGVFYYAEDYHQGYLHKHPGGYCNHGFCQIGYDLEAHGQTAARATLPDA